jgi:hypothetical protein
MKTENTKRIEDYIISIEIDENAENPRTLDNLGKIYLHNFKSRLKEINISFVGWKKFEETLIDDCSPIIVLPIYFNVGDFLPFTIKENNNIVGYTWILKKDFEKENISIEKAKEILEDELFVYSKYLDGEVYSYKIEKIEKCNLGHEHRNIVEYVGGYYDVSECEINAEQSLKYILEIENRSKE